MRDDFDKENNYRGNSKYTINIKKGNKLTIEVKK